MLFLNNRCRNNFCACVMDARKVVDQGYFEVLSDRIERIKAKLLDGYEFVGRDRKAIVRQLRELEERVTELGSRESTKNAWEAVDELETLLSPELVQRLGTTDDMKTEAVLHRAEEIETVASQLAQVKELKDNINPESFQGIQEVERKLVPLSKVHLSQQHATAKMSKEVTELLANYNMIVEGLSQKFIEWDKLLTKMESV